MPSTAWRQHVLEFHTTRDGEPQELLPPTKATLVGNAGPAGRCLWPSHRIPGLAGVLRASSCSALTCTQSCDGPAMDAVSRSRPHGHGSSTRPCTDCGACLLQGSASVKGAQQQQQPVYIPQDATHAGVPVGAGAALQQPLGGEGGLQNAGQRPLVIPTRPPDMPSR